MSNKALFLLNQLTVSMALLFAGQVMAQDSGVGIDLWTANSLHTDAGASLYQPDPRGTSFLHSGQNRTPTGFLLMCPAVPPDLDDGDEWQAWGVIDIGYLVTSGDTENAEWLRFEDWDDGLVLGLLDYHMIRPGNGQYADMRASYIGDNNYYAKARAGRAGHYRITGFARATPNIVSGNARSIWNGIGSDNLTLAGGLTPGASTPVQVAELSAATPEHRLQVNREKQGLGINYYFNTRWTGYATVTHEQRSGSRPFGGPFFFNYPFPDNGGIYEIPRPIDDLTMNFNAGLRFAGDIWRMDLGYSGSLYRSDSTSFSYEVPFGLWNVIGGPPSTSAQLTSGTFSTEPDNDYHNLRATLTRKLPMNGQLSLTASGGIMRQNDDLVPPINCQGTFGIDLVGNGQVAPNNPFLYNCSDWNTTDALSRKRADMQIDTTLVDLRLILQPNDRLTWRSELRFHKEDYRNTYVAYNPLTGEYGYVAENGAQGSVVPGEAGIWNAITAPSVLTKVASLPLDVQTTELNTGVDWRISMKQSIGAEIAFLRNEPGNRERTEIDDLRVRLNWSTRSYDWLTFRANYVYLDRSGDSYNYNPYKFTLSPSLPGYVMPPAGLPPHTVDALRKYDMASRTSHKISLMATTIVATDMTVSLGLRGEWNDYDAVLGRQAMDTAGATVQWEWQPRPGTSADVFIGYDRSKLKMANVNDSGIFVPDPSLGGPVYPLASRWWADDSQHNTSVGANIAQAFSKVRLDASWTYYDARGTTRSSYASPSALAWPLLANDPANAFPDMDWRINTLTISATFTLTERTSLRIFNQYESGKLRDWHYDGFDQGQVYDHRVYTDGGPENYDSNLFGAFLVVKL